MGERVMELKKVALLMLYVGGAWFSGFLCGKGNEISTLSATITALIGTVYIWEKNQ